MYTPTKFFGVLWAKRLCGYLLYCIAKDTPAEMLRKLEAKPPGWAWKSRTGNQLYMVIFNFALSRFLFTVDQVVELHSKDMDTEAGVAHKRPLHAPPGWLEKRSRVLTASVPTLPSMNMRNCQEVSQVLGHNSVDVVDFISQ
jgi:hypothetical protein